jgi:hypothetical protein
LLFHTPSGTEYSGCTAFLLPVGKYRVAAAFGALLLGLHTVNACIPVLQIEPEVHDFTVLHRILL